MATDRSFAFDCSLDGLRDPLPDLDGLPRTLRESLRFCVTPMGEIVARGRRRGKPRLDTRLVIEPTEASMSFAEFVSALESLAPSILGLAWEDRNIWLFDTGDEAELTLEPELLGRLAALKLFLLVTA